MRNYEKINIEVVDMKEYGNVDVITASQPINLGYDTPIIDCLDYPGLGN